MVLTFLAKAVGYNWQTHQNFLALPRISFFAVPGFKIPQLQILLWFTCKSLLQFMWRELIVQELFLCASLR